MLIDGGGLPALPEKADAGFVRRPTRETAVRVTFVDAPEGLAGVRDPGCVAAIWRRQPEDAFQTWLDRLEPEQLPHARAILRARDVRAAMGHICDEAGTPSGSERLRLVDDVATLANLFAGLMRVNLLRLRLDVIATNACPKFHIDAVPARLICTYRGAGTQYGASIDGAEPRRIFNVPTGAPIVLRGTDWKGDRPSGLLHRSPPIEGRAEARLVLVLDPIEDRATK